MGIKTNAHIINDTKSNICHVNEYTNGLLWVCSSLQCSKILCLTLNPLQMDIKTNMIQRAISKMFVNEYTKGLLWVCSSLLCSKILCLTLNPLQIDTKTNIWYKEQYLKCM